MKGAKKDWVETKGNVFKALGFSDEEAAGLKLKSDLMDEIESYMIKNKLSQSKAAKVFGVSQPRISNLVKGKIDLFAVDGLIAMLNRAGVEVALKVSHKRGARNAA